MESSLSHEAPAGPVRRSYRTVSHSNIPAWSITRSFTSRPSFANHRGAYRSEDQHFPRLSKRDICNLQQEDDFQLRDHPITHDDEHATRPTIIRTVDALKELRRVVLPVYADVHFRLAWKLLPTRSRFFFFQQSSSTGLSCEHPECTGIETERHLFFDCPRVAALWTIIFDDWHTLLEPTNAWVDICLLREPKWTSRATSYSSKFSTMWMIIHGITLRVIWTTRNKHHFEDLPPLDAVQASYHIYSCFGAHFRALLRASNQAG